MITRNDRVRDRETCHEICKDLPLLHDVFSSKDDITGEDDEIRILLSNCLSYDFLDFSRSVIRIVIAIPVCIRKLKNPELSVLMKTKFMIITF